MKLMSASPSRTASKVWAGPTTAFGSRLHFTRPETAASASLQNPMAVVVSGWDGGTQALTFNVIWALAAVADMTTAPANAVEINQWFGTRVPPSAGLFCRYLCTGTA